MFDTYCLSWVRKPRQYVEHERRMSPEKMYVPEIYNCGGVKGLEKRVYEVFIHGMNLHGNYWFTYYFHNHVFFFSCSVFFFWYCHLLLSTWYYLCCTNLAIFGIWLPVTIWFTAIHTNWMCWCKNVDQTLCALHYSLWLTAKVLLWCCKRLNLVPGFYLSGL